MKFKYLAILGIAAVLTVSYAKKAILKQLSTQIQHTIASNIVAQAMQGTAANFGTFKEVGYINKVEKLNYSQA